MQKLIEFNENQDTPPYRPSHYWLQRDILQIKHFQYRFFNNIILTDDTIPQVKIFTHFLL